MEQLYYGTTERGWQRIQDQGFVSGPSFWATAALAEYRAEEASDADGTAPVVLVADIEAFDTDDLEADFNAIDQPNTRVLERTEQEVAELWEAAEQSWEDSLRIAGSVRCLAQVDVEDVGVAW